MTSSSTPQCIRPTTSRFLLAVGLGHVLCSTACETSGMDDAVGGAQVAGQAPLAVAAAPWDACHLGGLAGAGAALATWDGLAVASALAGSSEAGGVLIRYRGRGCALSPDGEPLAVESLLDADSRGNLYAFPRETTTPGVRPTVPPGAVGTRASVVVRIDGAGQVSSVVQAGRGIWMFGVSAAGGSFWVTACGPTGIFAMGSQPLRSLIEPPKTQWQLSGAVLTNDGTLWSLKNAECSADSPASTGCGASLVRSTAAGDQTVGPIAVDFDTMSGRALLFRCGDRLCTVAARTIVIRDSEGTVRRTIRAQELDLRPEEQIASVSSNQHGIYVLVTGGGGPRVLFGRE